MFTKSRRLSIELGATAIDNHMSGNDARSSAKEPTRDA
jgi:hypothetical protein